MRGTYIDSYWSNSRVQYQKAHIVCMYYVPTIVQKETTKENQTIILNFQKSTRELLTLDKNSTAQIYDFP